MFIKYIENYCTTKIKTVQMILFLLYHVVVGDVGKCVFSGDDSVVSKLNKLVGNDYSAKYKKEGQEYEFRKVARFCDIFSIWLFKRSQEALETQF